MSDQTGSIPVDQEPVTQADEARAQEEQEAPTMGAPARPSLKRSKALKIVLGTVGLAVVLCFVIWAVTSSLNNAGSKAPANGEPTSTPAPTATAGASSTAEATTTSEPAPWDTNGEVKSFQDIWQFYKYLKKSDPAKAKVYLRTVMAVRPHIDSDDDFERELLEHIAREHVGQNFLRQVKKGQTVLVTNTGYENGVPTFKVMALKPGTWYLVDKNGKVHTKSNCKNPLGRPMGQRQLKQVRKEIAKFCTDGTRPDDPLNETDVAQNGDARSGGTPDYNNGGNGASAGDAENTVNQINQNGGGANPATDGHDSAKNGGVSAPGGATGPGGQETAPAPSTDPVDTPTAHKDITSTVSP